MKSTAPIAALFAISLLADSLGISPFSSAWAQRPPTRLSQQQVHRPDSHQGNSHQGDSKPLEGHRGARTLASRALVSRMLQNEIQDLPADHSALFSAAREVSIELEVPSTGDLAVLENALVTVIRPNGQMTEVRPDDGGLVVLEQVEEGPHAFVVSSEQVHGAKLFYLEEATQEEVESVPDSRMTLVDISGEQLRPFIDEIREVRGSMSDLERSLPIGPEFGYRVALEDDGAMRGTVLPIADRSDSLLLDGTRLAIFFRGIQVAETTCDESGEFVIRGMRPGIHGLVAAGPEGYAAFSFETVSADTEVAMRSGGQRYVARMLPPADKVPVVLIPPPMIPCLVKAIERYYGYADSLPFASGSFGVPVGGFMTPTYGGFGGGGGGGGAVSGLEGLAALIGIGAIAATSNDDDDVILLPPTASPARPGVTGVGN